MAVLGTSLIFSTTVEVLQIFISHRSSTKADIFANGLGGLLGYWSFLLFRWCVLVPPTKLRAFFQPRHVIFCLITYLAAIICITISLSNSVSLTNWNTSFPLVLGNEATGDRPWNGSINQLSIFDCAFNAENVEQFLIKENISSNSKSSPLVYYSMSHSGNYKA